MATSHTEHEIAGQPDLWRRAAQEAADWGEALPDPSTELVVVGSGTSLYMGLAYARARETAGMARTDAIVASELPNWAVGRDVLAITRSGTTTDVLTSVELLHGRSRIVVITTAPESPIAALADVVIDVSWAAERSVVGTQSATTTLAGLRASLGMNVESIAAAADRFLNQSLPLDPGDYDRFVFLGQAWAEAIAHEGALKLREMAGTWTESYSTLEYLHGPISAGGHRSVVWTFGSAPDSAASRIRDAGDQLVHVPGDPMAVLVLVQRLGVELARLNGRDPDHPPNLEASVVH